MTDQLPSKDVPLPTLMAWLRDRHAAEAAAGNEWSYEGLIHAHIEHLQRELAREVGTRAARVAEIDALRSQLNKAVVERNWALGALERFQVGDEVTYLGVPTKIAEIKTTYVLEGGTVVQPRMLTRRAAQPPGDG